MRIRETTSFPHPVLSPYTHDYAKGLFALELDDIEENVQGGIIVIGGRILLEESGLEQLVRDGKIRTGLMVTCQGTYLDEWHGSTLGKFKLELGGGRLRGAVYVQALAVAVEDIYLPGTGLASGFTEYARNIHAGSPVAVSVEQQLETGFDKLVAMESIFSLSPDESLTDDIFRINTDSEIIEIWASNKLFTDIQNLRGTVSRDILLSALYLPVMMEVLDTMRNGDFAERRWHRVIKAKCNAEGIFIDQNTANIPEVAQKLLNAPLGLLIGAVENSK